MQPPVGAARPANRRRLRSSPRAIRWRHLGPGRSQRISLALPGLVSALPALEREVIVLWFFQDLDQDAMAARVGYSQMHGVAGAAPGSGPHARSAGGTLTWRRRCWRCRSSGWSWLSWASAQRRPGARAGKACCRLDQAVIPQPKASPHCLLGGVHGPWRVTARCAAIGGGCQPTAVIANEGRRVPGKKSGLAYVASPPMRVVEAGGFTPPAQVSQQRTRLAPSSPGIDAPGTQTSPGLPRMNSAHGAICCLITWLVGASA
jgi:hypothetical protein